MGIVWRLRFKHKQKLRNRSPGIQWWHATSTETPRAITRAFREERVGGVLYDAIRTVQTTEDLWDRHLILVQLDVPEDWRDRGNVELCLHELGVRLVTPVTTGETNGQEEQGR